jgi:transposase
MARHLIAWKNDPQSSRLKQAPSQTLQHGLKKLDTAYKRYFDQVTDRPAFKKRRGHDSFRFPQGFTLVQKLHGTIANVRRDFLHKTSTAISKNHALACIEDLKVAHMSRSVKGSKAQPGTTVRRGCGDLSRVAAPKRKSARPHLATIRLAALPGYFPVQRGARFSANAMAPSFASADASTGLAMDA